MHNKEIYTKDNSIGLIRIITAYTVALGHFCNILQKYYTGDSRFFMHNIWQITAMVSGVVIFFALSGFLNWSSYERKSGIKEFYKKKLTRIYPPLWIWSLIAIVIMLVIAQRIDVKEVILFGVLQSFGVSYTPGFLKEIATGSVNGALWTITVQIQLYILTPLFFEIEKKIKSKKSFWGILIIIGLICNVLYDQLFEIVPDYVGKLLSRTCLPTMLWYILGMFISKYRKWMISFLRKYTVILILLYLVYRCSGHRVLMGYYADIVTGVILPFAAVGIAFKVKQKIKIPDFSYSMFLLHWPILNIIVGWKLMEKMSVYIMLCIFLVLITVLSYISFITLENISKIKVHEIS